MAVRRRQGVTYSKHDQCVVTLACIGDEMDVEMNGDVRQHIDVGVFYYMQMCALGTYRYVRRCVGKMTVKNVCTLRRTSITAVSAYVYYNNNTA